MKDGTQMHSKANISQCHNGNNHGSSSSSYHQDILHPTINTLAISAQRPGILVISINLASLHQAQTSLFQQSALIPSSPFPSPALSLSGTNQPFTNTLDASAKQEFMEAVHHAWETQGNIELAAIDLNSLLHPGNASNSAMNALIPVVTPEAICVEGLDTDDNNDVEDDCKDKVEPPTMTSILFNHQHTTA
ncbi:hypothetical protein QOT17_020118 [Balamuthia mandrillaris]